MCRSILVSQLPVSDRARAGWPLGVFGLGLVALVGGYREFRLTSGRQSICHLVHSLSTLSGSLVPGTPATAPGSCASPDHRYYGSWALMLVGLAATVVGAVVLAKQARRSRVLGHPWPIHRASVSVCRWIDTQLPGHDAANPARLGPATMQTLVVVVGFAISIGGAHAWNRQGHAVRVKAHERASVALTALTLPTALSRSENPSCHPSPDTLCAVSRLPADEVQPMLIDLLHGRSEIEVCSRIPPGPGGPCPVVGSVDGYRAFGFAFPHLLRVDQGPPPSGAKPVTPGNTRLFYFGTDVTINLDRVDD